MNCIFDDPWMRSRVVGVIVLLIGFDQVLAAAPATGKRPNLQFILTDDQRIDTLGCYGPGGEKEIT
jgi:hypothetical protein